MKLFVRAFAGFSSRAAFLPPRRRPNGICRRRIRPAISTPRTSSSSPQDVDKATGGSLKITVHPAGALIKHADIKRAVRQGTAPIGEIIISLATNEAPIYGRRLAAVPRHRLRRGQEALCGAQAVPREAARRGRADAAVSRCRGRRRASIPRRRSRPSTISRASSSAPTTPIIGRIAALAGAIPTQIEVPDLPTAFATGRVDVMITSASTGVDTKAAGLSHPLHRHRGLAAAQHRVRQQGRLRQAHRRRRRRR